MKKIILLIFIANLSFSQTKTDNLIVTYYDDSGGHGVEFYTWIIPVKSINIITWEYSLIPLYIDTFSKNNLDDCIENKEVDMFVHKVGTNYNFDEKYKKDISNLLKLIKEKSTLVHDISIKKKYPLKEKNRLKISILPVGGKFQFCRIKKSAGIMIKYQGEIAFPLSSLYLNPKILENNDVQEFIYSFDFSQIKFRNDFK